MPSCLLRNVLGLLIDVEVTRRANNQLQRRIRAARFPLPATIEDLDLSARRGLKRAEVLQLAQSEWVGRHLNLLILGATGVGKSYLASALGRAACQADYSVRYERTSRLLQALELARADGSYPQLLRTLARTHLLILDDWLRDPLSAPRPESCSKSWMTAMVKPLLWSPPRSRWLSGITAFPTPRFRMPFSTVLSTTPIAWNYKESL
jgi:DNA replication protein DnaC